MISKALFVAALLSAPLALAACDDDDDNNSPNPTPTIQPAQNLIGIDPLGGSDNIGTDEKVTLLFDGGMDTTSVMMDLHSPDIAGATSEMDCDWLNDNTQLVCSPLVALTPNSTYMIHVAGAGFRNSEGDLVTIPTGVPLNGTAVMPMTGEMHAGQPFAGMDEGWADAAGAFGTSFTFETGAGPSGEPPAGGTGGDAGTGG